MVEQRAKEAQLHELVELSRLIVSSRDPAEIRRLAVEAATRLVDAERASLLRLDGRAGRLYFEVALGDGTGELKRVRMVPGQGIAGRALQTCTPLIVNDVRADDRFFGDLDEKTGFVTRSMICVPLACKDRPLGVLEVLNKRSGEFDADDLEVVVALGNQIAIALDNARLYERLRASLVEFWVYTAIFAVTFVAIGAWLISLSW